MSYYFSKILNVSFDEAIAKVLEGLKQEGFGVLTEIDVQATMKKKFDCLAKEEKWKSNADRFCGLSVLS